MQAIHDVETLTDDELLRRLAALLASSRHNEAALVAHMGEVDARRLYARLAAPSMFVYCTERLHLSEAEACLRIAAARASREHPVILEMLADGRLQLSAVAKLAPHLTAQNRDELLRRATHRTKREIDELLAQLFALLVGTSACRGWLRGPGPRWSSPSPRPATRSSSRLRRSFARSSRGWRRGGSGGQNRRVRPFRRATARREREGSRPR